jgi:uncharacterized protein GlcG (DUF336 family)
MSTAFRDDIPGIQWQAAQRAIAAALSEAERLGVRVNAAVVDRGGNLMAFGRMNGAFLHSIEIAIDKAYTAASFGFPTSQWMSVFAGNEGLKIGITSRPRVVVLGGGVPIQDGDVVCGGIGVSGASEEQDALCALAGVKALQTV